MGLFDFFRKKEQTQQALAEQNQSNTPQKSDIPSDIGATGLSGNGYSAELTSFGSRLPIDMIYSFLREDFEQRAYHDALTSPDSSYKETNLSIIRSNLEVMFRQTTLKYGDLLREIDFHILSREQAGLTDIVELLKSRKITYAQHVEELNRMKADLDNGELYMTGIFKSYEVGFTRGLASLSLQNFKMDHTS